MSKLYKLTDRDGQTRNGTQWGHGMSHSGTGEGELCGPGWIHAYEHPLIAVLVNPIHANFPNPRLWEAEGEIGLRDGQLKCGCKTLTTVREIPLPAVTTEMRVRFGILCAKEVCAYPAWSTWADRWLSGEDRTQAAAERARASAAEARARASERAYERASERASERAEAEAAEAAAEGARAAVRAWARADAWDARSAAWSAAWAAARAAEAARDLDAIAAAMAAEAAREVGHRIDFFAIAEKACSGLRNKAGISKGGQNAGQKRECH